MLNKITLRNFKSFRDSTFELGPLTIMVGANASGKSNFVDALRFLQGCTRSLKVSEILLGKWQGGQQVWLPIRGNEQEVFNLFQDDQSFKLSIDWEMAWRMISGKYSIAVRAFDTKVAFEHEHWTLADESYISHEKNYDISQFDFINVLPDVPPKIRQMNGFLRDWLSDLYFMDLAPVLMREYVSIGRSKIGMRGENLSAVLFKLISNPEQRRTVLDWIKELCSYEIIDFDFVETKLGDVLFAIKEPNGVTISARSMSDGTLRFLAIVAAMLSVEEGTTFVVEEIDNDLHPSRLHLLISFLEQVTASRKLQVIASTHSPYLLDQLSKESLKNVLVFHRDQQSAETKVTKLIDIPGFAEARKNMPLDLMHASSWMEQNL